MISQKYEEAITAARVLLDAGHGEYNPNVYTILKAHQQAIEEVALRLTNHLIPHAVHYVKDIQAEPGVIEPRLQGQGETDPRLEG